MRFLQILADHTDEHTAEQIAELIRQIIAAELIRILCSHGFGC